MSVITDSLSREFARLNAEIQRLTSELAEANKTLETGNECYLRLHVEAKNLRSELAQLKTQPTSEEFEAKLNAFRAAILKMSQKAGRTEVTEVAAARSSLDSIRQRYEARISELERATRILNCQVEDSQTQVASLQQRARRWDSIEPHLRVTVDTGCGGAVLELRRKSSEAVADFLLLPANHLTPAEFADALSTPDKEQK